MDGKIEQRVCYKLCVNLDKSATETLEMLHEAFGEHSLSRTAVFEWYSRFKVGRVSVEDDERSGPPSTSKTTENVENFEIVHRDKKSSGRTSFSPHQSTPTQAALRQDTQHKQQQAPQTEGRSFRHPV
jgi:hypothetical protein